MNLPDPLKLHNTYNTNPPFPNIVLDDVFDPETLKIAEKEFFEPDDERWKLLGHKNVKNKYFYNDMKDMPVACGEIINKLQSNEFTAWLSKITGFRNLVSDPYLNGGGLHMMGRDGFLQVHTDFNYHKKLKGNRKVNVLLFLNSKWKKEWHGEFELWSRDCYEMETFTIPDIGSAAIFSTTLYSYHGVPKPLQCPDGRFRKSIATYYYQLGEPTDATHGTNYKGT